MEMRDDGKGFAKFGERHKPDGCKMWATRKTNFNAFKNQKVLKNQR